MGTPTSNRLKGVLYSVSQDLETPLQETIHDGLRLRYAYTRSAECQAIGVSGEDYFSIRVDLTRYAFALCDGVSLSFFGGVAAKLLGDELVGWLWNDGDV